MNPIVQCRVCVGGAVLSSGNLYNKYAMQPLLRWGRHCAGIEGRSIAGAMKISRFFFALPGGVAVVHLCGNMSFSDTMTGLKQRIRLCVTTQIMLSRGRKGG
jgi:hypothetical protein